MDTLNEIINFYINHKVNNEVRRQARLIIDTLKEKVLSIISNEEEKREVEEWFRIVKERV